VYRSDDTHLAKSARGFVLFSFVAFALSTASGCNAILGNEAGGVEPDVPSSGAGATGSGVGGSGASDAAADARAAVEGSAGRGGSSGAGGAGAAGATTDAGIILRGGIVTLGASVSPTASITVLRNGWTIIPPTCTGSICVSGGMAP
jgi:hypothetical protein